MTVDELREALIGLEGTAPVYFQPDQPCGMGFPTFYSARIREELAYDDNDQEEPTGRIWIELTEEASD